MKLEWSLTWHFKSHASGDFALITASVSGRVKAPLDYGGIIRNELPEHP